MFGLEREPGVRPHSCYPHLRGGGTDRFCTFSEDYVGLQRETIDPVHEKNLLMELSKTSGLIGEISSLSLRTVKQRQDDNGLD